MQKLIEQARMARTYAYTPYSHFAVGAAVMDSDGRIYTGCNIENASYGLTICAERTAIFKAISEGAHDLTAIAVIADTPGPTAPCGACRQVIAEFGINTIILCNTNGDMKTLNLKQLLPYAFTKSDMPGDE